MYATADQLTDEQYASSPSMSSNTTTTTTNKPKCAQLQIPNERCFSAGIPASGQCSRADNKLGQNVSKCFQSLFEENLDKLKGYMTIVRQYDCQVKSFSTSDILVQASMESNIVSSRKYLSECDLMVYSRHNSNCKKILNDYITCSCSTLAICGDTIHSSLLPSPQTQSVRQINSFIFSDLDLIKSISKKVRDVCINQRLAEFVKSVDICMLQDSDIQTISKLSSNILVRPIKLNYFQEDKQLIGESGDILIHVIDYENDDTTYITKHDKEMFVLNWLQTVETGSLEQD